MCSRKAIRGGFEITLRTTSKATFLGLCFLIVCAPGALAQKRTTAETTLVGIKLYDTALRLLDVYGNPDEIQAVGAGAQAIGPAAGGGAAPAAAGGGPAGGRGGGRFGGGRGGGGAAGDFTTPFGFGDETLLFGGQGPSSGGSGGGSQGGPGGPPPGVFGPRGGNQQRNPGPGVGQQPNVGAGAAPPVQSVQVAAANYTRWIYKRGGGKYGFILDKASRVVQIEAIGLENNKVKTRRGIGFGATFAKIIRTYGLPDSYDVGGTAITMRYLNRDKVVFRLNRLGVDKPHVVTGILVAAGKS